MFIAKRFHTMEVDNPVVEAVAVLDGRIVATGSLGSVAESLGDTPFVIDESLSGRVVMPGLIDQHLHPLLGATTLATEVIAPEEWVLPDVTFPGANTPAEYLARLRAADSNLADPNEWLFSWGYHSMWHGKLDRQTLDEISTTRPIGVWQRSCHEFFLNTVAIDQLGITEASLSNRGPASDQVDLANGHFWETGLFNLVFPKLVPTLMSRERLTRGLHQLVAYLHQNGVTAFNEPGIVWAIEPWDLYQEILGADAVPFLSTFMVDGRLQAARRMDPQLVVSDAEAQVAQAPSGKVALLDKHVKLFADGAILSQMMQMRDGYLDAGGQFDPDHHGEWIMQPADMAEFYRIYWDAGWQVHTHVNGDLGLDVVLDALETCMRANPRVDHRCVIVHFANSTEEQIDRIARLGAIVSANPYYPCGFADKYSEHGLGPERADVMVRSRSVLDRGISLSFHSDLPIAPAVPLKLASYAVNRTTQSGRVAGPEQRISVHEALRAVTIDAAYSWRREDDLGSIKVGKAATFTVLEADPYEVDPEDLGDIPVVGIVFQGQWSPVPENLRRSVSNQAAALTAAPTRAVIIGAAAGHGECDEGGCSCTVARRLMQAYQAAFDPAA